MVASGESWKGTASAPAEGQAGAGVADGVVSELVLASAFRSERVLALARALFATAILVRALLVTTPTFARLATGVPPLLAALSFSLYVLVRRKAPRVDGGFFVLSVSLDAAVCFAALLPMALWPELSRVPLLDKADISGLLLVIAASAFRHSARASLLSWLLNTASFCALMHWDRAAPWTSVERNVALLFLLYLAGAGCVAALVAQRTRTLVASSAKAALEAERARRNLALVLREHHDLRSQLASATLNANLAHRELAQSPVSGLASFIDRVQQSLARVNGAVASIKERSYAELARLEVVRPADLRSAANVVREELRLRYPDARLELRMPARALEPWVAGGNEALRCVLRNLATNACEGSGPRAATTIIIEGGSTPEGDVSIVVRDDGPGFSDLSLAAAGRVRSSTKPEGLGLGLVLVRKIVEASGGRVVCANDEEWGARVELSLPVESAGCAAVALPRSALRGA